jgi:hypothetical protein
MLEASGSDKYGLVVFEMNLVMLEQKGLAIQFLRSVKLLVT